VKYETFLYGRTKRTDYSWLIEPSNSDIASLLKAMVIEPNSPLGNGLMIGSFVVPFGVAFFVSYRFKKFKDEHGRKIHLIAGLSAQKKYWLEFQDLRPGLFHSCAQVFLEVLNQYPDLLTETTAPRLRSVTIDPSVFRIGVNAWEDEKRLSNTNRSIDLGDPTGQVNQNRNDSRIALDRIDTEAENTGEPANVGFEDSLQKRTVDTSEQSNQTDNQFGWDRNISGFSSFSEEKPKPVDVFQAMRDELYDAVREHSEQIESTVSKLFETVSISNPASHPKLKEFSKLMILEHINKLERAKETGADSRKGSDEEKARSTSDLSLNDSRSRNPTEGVTRPDPSDENSSEKLENNFTSNSKSPGFLETFMSIFQPKNKE
jgi:hypothetical protein